MFEKKSELQESAIIFARRGISGGVEWGRGWPMGVVEQSLCRKKHRDLSIN